MNSLISRFEEELSDIRAMDAFRSLKPPRGHDFCSNDYLKLAHHPSIIAGAKQGLSEHGFGSSSSRYVRGDRDIWCKVENELAKFKGTNRALMFSSGYAANIGALPSLIANGDVVFSDSLNHASLIDGLRLSRCETVIYHHLDFSHLVEKIEKIKPSQGFIVTESLFSMDGDIADLKELATIAKQYGLGLIVDESHAVGLFGKKGSGLVEHFGVTDDVTLSINGLGKAFGCYGAFVAGDDCVVELVKQKARSLIYSTALPPLHGFAILAALKLIDEDLRNKLWQNCDAINNSLVDIAGFHKYTMLTPIFAVVVRENARALNVANILQENGFDVRAIRPPSVPLNTARLRLTANVHQTLDEVQRLASLLGRIL